MHINVKRACLSVLMLISCGFGAVFTQTTIPNGDFEQWSAGGIGQYENPSGGWWTSLNALSSLGGPVTVEKVNGAAIGTYAAKLTTKQWGSILLPGLLVSGTFDAQNPNFLVQGKPFTDLPERFLGYLKYSPVGGDSAGIAALLTRWNTTTGQRDTLAEAALVQYDTVNAWTLFDLPFVYSQQGVNPDSIIVAVVSSFGGSNFMGQVGSTLWIDALDLAYLANAQSDPLGNEIAVNLHIDNNQVDLSIQGKAQELAIRIWAMDGRMVLDSPVKVGQQSLNFAGSSGIYLAEITEKGKTVWHQKILAVQ